MPSVEKEHDLFLVILGKLDKEEVLRDIILVGGWCPLVYKEYFGILNPFLIIILCIVCRDIIDILCIK